MMTSRRIASAVLFALLVGGCAVAPTGEEPAPPSGQPQVPPSENVAVASLVADARADIEANRLGSAAATLERALRIEPRNPRLWHELARVRLRQGDYAQAEATAQRSNAWAQGDAELRAANRRIIEEAREARR